MALVTRATEEAEGNKAMTKKKRGVALASVAGLAVASFFFLRSVYTENPPASEISDQAAAAAQDRQTPPSEEQADQGDTEVITGQMTLSDIQRLSGIRAAEVAKRLNLPSDVPMDEPLGRLRQKYPFTMDQARGIVVQLSENAGEPIPAGAIERNTRMVLQTPHDEAEPQLTRGRGAEDQSGILITGQTTLREIETRSGVSARLIADRLGLPSNVSPDAQLGKLRRTYRFTMQEVRDIVSDLMKHARP